MHKKKLIWLLALLALGLVAAGATAYVLHLKADPMAAFADAPAPPAPQATARPAATPTPEPTLSPEEALEQEADKSILQNRLNILMLGWDQSPEREDETSELYRDESNNFRSDVLMLLSIDFDAKDVRLISIPRDTMAAIYNVTGRWKINAAFAKGGSAAGDGFHYAIETIQNLLQVPIQYYAGVDMNGLKALVEAMGGVDYDVDVRIALNGRVLEKGPQHMDGQQVLDYCRARKGISTDVGRADRQQRMLFAIFQQMKSTDQLVRLPKIYASVQDMIYTNLSAKQIAALTLFAMDLDMEDLHRHTLAGEYISKTPYSGAAYYVLDTDALKALMQELFGVELQVDFQYDYRYVRADKAAATALSYVDAAGYITDEVLLSSYAGESYGLPEAIAAVQAVAQRQADPTWTEEQLAAYMQQPLDLPAIEAAAQALLDRIYSMCQSYGVTQANLDAKRVPAELYAVLSHAEQSASADTEP
ncbi:MAG: LCP family protein [Christensenellaceae bacterium]|jgi:LCP family protein required for cell wall assembly|nr:LCP family protein [Christensenellaceae bacterium]